MEVLEKMTFTKMKQKNKGAGKNMQIITYTDFYNMFKDYLDGQQFSIMQKLAFSTYEDVLGYRPKRDRQKQSAYSYMFNKLCNMDIDEWIAYLTPLGVHEIVVIELYKKFKQID